MAEENESEVVDGEAVAEALFVEFEDALMDLASKYKREGLPHDEIVSVLEMRIALIKEGGEDQY